MAAETVDEERRDFLYIATGAFAAIGGAAALWPLIDQMNPDLGAQALASVEVDLSPVAVGQAITVMWRGKPVFIRHRTAEEVKEAEAVPLSELRDKDARNAALGPAPAIDDNRIDKGHREWLVLIGICTHLGCIPKGQKLGDSRGDYGGWFCPCHGSHYDTAGRIRKGPAPQNLPVPSYKFSGDGKMITIG